MSGGAGAAPPSAVLGLGLDPGGRWHGRETRALVQTYLLPSSVQPPPAAGGARGTRTGTGTGTRTRTPVRLPSLAVIAKGPRRRSSTAPLSLSGPSLPPDDSVLLEGFSGLRGPRRPSPLPPPPPPPPPPPFTKSSVPLPFKTRRPPGSGRQPDRQPPPGCGRPAFIHFSRAIQPGAKPRPARRHSHNAALSAEKPRGDLRPLVAPYRNWSPQGEALSVVGRPCLPSCSERPAMASSASSSSSSTSSAAGPSRTHLHVFLPTEAEGVEPDGGSVDEGFMDELDSKVTSLKLLQGAPETLSYH